MHEVPGSHPHTRGLIVCCVRKENTNEYGRTTDLKTSLDSPGVNPGKFGGTGTPFSTLFQGQNQYDWRSKSDSWRGEGGGNCVI